MRICQLASGSKGNSIYIESEKTRILIDAGLSALQISKRLAAIGVEAQTLDAVFVTHEHSDHSRGIGPLSRRYALPIYLHQATHAKVAKLGAIQERFFDIGQTIAIRDIEVNSFPITHDAVAPVGFTVETKRGKVGIATDLGIATRLVQDRLRQCQVLILETNHDEELLRKGPYPWELKQRIRSHHGHLSNGDGADLLAQVLWDGLQAVFLAHLSETNNTPQLAQRSVAAVLSQQNLCQPQMIIGAPQQVSDCFDSDIY
ncbi:MAG: MBL fold metallo-hydrolase [Thermodesulfobacteriota bacterium]|nr:MBL fold metallo-hydrolase [Thermodesulfobacteriota bacterium]